MRLMNLHEQTDWDFGRARRRALLGRLASLLRGEPAAPRTFDEVRRSLRAHNRVRKGLRIVDPKRVVGSVGRRRDFDRDFMPLRSSAGERWKRVDHAYYRDVSLPPVSLYKIGDEYFVEDGNHRVSVARFHGLPALEAEVTEFRPMAIGGPEVEQADVPVKKAA